LQDSWWICIHKSPGKATREKNHHCLNLSIWANDNRKKKKKASFNPQLTDSQATILWPSLHPSQPSQWFWMPESTLEVCLEQGQCSWNKVRRTRLQKHTVSHTVIIPLSGEFSSQ
jgi:hypothetical protein